MPFLIREKPADRPGGQARRLCVLGATGTDGLVGYRLAVAAEQSHAGEAGRRGFR